MDDLCYLPDDLILKILFCSTNINYIKNILHVNRNLNEIVKNNGFIKQYVLNNFSSKKLYDSFAHYAAYNNNINMIKALRYNEFYLDERSYNNWTPIQISARRGHINILITLYDYGCNIHTRDKDGQNLIFSCALYGNAKCFDLLQEWGCNILLNDYHGNSPIEVAALNGHLEILKKYKKSGCNLNAISKSGKRPIDYAIQFNKNNCIEYLRNLN